LILANLNKSKHNKELIKYVPIWRFGAIARTVILGLQRQDKLLVPLDIYT
jgi:hypothetical protein